MHDSAQVEHLSLALEKYSIDDQSLKLKIQHLVNDLIVHDFNQLVNFLYRIDVSENKLKKILHHNPTTDAAVIITDLLIERQLEKLKARKAFKENDNIDESDKW